MSEGALKPNSKLRSVFEIVSTVIVTAAAVAVLGRIVSDWRAQAVQASQPPRPIAVTGLTIDRRVATLVLGNAPVAFVEFSDYQCPYCAQFAKERYPRIIRDLVKTGKIMYVSVNFPLTNIHPLAEGAAEAAQCAARQDLFWPMHDRLFAVSPDLSVRRLEEHARAVGLNLDKYRECMGSDVAGTIKAEIDEGKRVGVTGTPSFFIGSVNDDNTITPVVKFVGDVTAEVIQQQLDKLSPPPTPAK